MSYLRIFGLIIGLVGIYLAIIKYRGVTWNKWQFSISFLLAASILAISVNPDLIDTLPYVFNLQDNERGRLLSLMLIAIFSLIYGLIDYRDKHIKLTRQFDQAIRKISQLSLPKNFKDKVYPIMVLIPAYNEADNLKILLKRIPSQIDGIKVGCLVVDDGSTDGTKLVVEQNGCLCVSNLVNRGQGSASLLGYDILKNHDAVSVIVTLDADNQHDPDQLGRIIAPILSKESDLVIGSRRLGDEQYNSIIRSIGVRGLTSIINVIAGTNLTDCSSGYKAFSKKALNSIQLFENQYQSTEVIISAAKAGLVISEVPISLSLRVHGETKKGNTIQYGFRFIKVLIKSWWR